MASQYGTERDRDAEESWQQIAWPLAFPVKPHDVRPLAVGAAGDVAATMGWSLPYTLGVLSRWKMSPVYCVSPWTARQLKRWTWQRRTWRLNNWRGSKRARRRKRRCESLPACPPEAPKPLRDQRVGPVRCPAKHRRGPLSQVVAI